MSNSAISGFKLYDIFTRIAPGSLFVATGIFVSFDISTIIQFSDSNTAIVAFLLVSFLVGEYIDILRKAANPVPTNFRYVLHTESDGDLNVLRLRDRAYIWASKIPGMPDLEPINYSIFHNSDQSFWDHIQENSNLTRDHNARDIFRVFKLRFESDISESTKRIQTIYEFHKNMMYSALLSTMLFSIYVHELTSNIGETFAITVLILMFVAAPSLILMSLEETYTDSLLTDYFSKQKSEEDSKQKSEEKL